MEQNPDLLTIEIAKNIAANGRMYCAMMFVAAIAAYAHSGSADFLRLSFAFVLPVGASCLADGVTRPALKGICALAIYAWAIVFTLIFFFAIG